MALQSWAQWVARATGLPLTNHATDGAGAADVVVARFPPSERTAVPGAGYHLGAIYIGVNDVRAVDWDAARYEAAFALRSASCAPAATACWRSPRRSIWGGPRPGPRWAS